MPSLKIGLLGGSFNPAHEGHKEISETAIRSLGLDQVWWLVSPQNPLKSSDETADYESRIAGAREVANNPKILISDFEKKLGQSYTAKTLNALKLAYPDHKFVWLMGADNLVQIPKWYRWNDIFDSVPVAVFDRPGYTYQALAGQAARLYEDCRIYPTSWGAPVSRLAMQNTPCWTFIPQTKHKISSTYIRKITNN